MGIPRDEIAQVTRRFFRGRGAGTGGSGLGLAIADRIARLHGGALRRLEGEGGFGVALTGRSLPSPDPTQPAQALAD